MRVSAVGTGRIAALTGSDLVGEVGGWLEAGQVRARSHGPLAGCVVVLRVVFDADDRAERAACLLSDIVLAWALNWKNMLSVWAHRLAKTALRDLACRAEALRVVAPKLRAKGSVAAVELFLSEDAVAPASMLSPRTRGTSIPMTDRAARRFCDRLVELGVARELTGRPTFRLCGIVRGHRFPNQDPRRGRWPRQALARMDGADRGGAVCRRLASRA